jgi:hypothetical protein
MKHDDLVDRAVGLWRTGDEFRAATIVEQLIRSGDPERAAAGGRAVVAIASEFGPEARTELCAHMETIVRLDRRAAKERVPSPLPAFIAFGLLVVAIMVFSVFVVIPFVRAVTGNR